MIVQAYYRKLGWLVYPKFSGPIDIILINEETGKVRFIDVKYKNTRKGTKTNGRRINRTVKTPLKKFLDFFFFRFLRLSSHFHYRI